jgi:hypothetical protein
MKGAVGTNTSPIAHTTGSIGKPCAEMTRNDARSCFDAQRFAVVPIRMSELHRSMGLAQGSWSDEMVLSAIHWPIIPPLAKSRIPASVVPPLHDCVKFGRVRVNFSTYEAMRDESPVTLTSMEFRTLKFFIANPRRVISRDELLNKIWGYDSYPCTRTVDNRILRLRQKLEADAANPKHFLTVYGAGYKFIP